MLDRLPWIAASAFVGCGGELLQVVGPLGKALKIGRQMRGGRAVDEPVGLAAPARGAGGQEGQA